MPTREEVNRVNARAQALGEAAARGDLIAMRAMLAEEPALAKQSRPFSDACKNGQPDAVLEIIRAGADVNTTHGSGPGCTQKPLLWTIRPVAWTSGHRRVLEILLDHGADPSGGQSEEIVTPLIAAAEWGHPDAVALLVERGARVGFREAIAIADSQKVHAALADKPSLATTVYQRAVGFLHECGTPLHFAALSRLGNDNADVAARLADIVEMLIVGGAVVHAFAFDGETVPSPSGVAARAGNVAVLCALLQHDADPQDALGPALTGSSLDVLGILDGFRLDLDLPGDPKLGNSVLQEMIRWGKIQSAQWLVDRGADVNATDAQGWTALHYSCSRGVSPDFIQLLLDHGADIDVPDHAGMTPLSLARQRKHQRLIGFLEAR